MAAIDPIRNAMNVTFSTPETPKVAAPEVAAPAQQQVQQQVDAAPQQETAQDYSQHPENQAATLSISMPSKQHEGEETEEQIQKQNENLRKSIE